MTDPLLVETSELIEATILTDLQSLKLQGLGCRHYTEHLLSLFADFQAYVEQLEPQISSGVPGPQIEESYEKFRLSFQENEAAFLEWDDGDRVINPAVAQFLNRVDGFRGKPKAFNLTLSLASTKFQHLIMKQERELHELHDKIELLSTEAEADKVTAIRPSIIDRIRGLDDVSDRGYKWLERAIALLPKALSFIEHHRN
jgi:hypothetical protein